MNRKQKIIVSITGIFIVLLALVGLTYAYFLTRITGNENEKSISVTTANLELVYGDNSEEIIKGTGALIPTIGTEEDDAIGTKTFTVTNNGNDSSYVVVIDNVGITNESDGSATTFNTNDFRYTLTCSVKDKSGVVKTSEKCNGVNSLGIFPIDGGILVGNAIPENRIHEYTLTLWYIDNGKDQSIDMNKTYQARVNISDVVQIENPFKTGSEEVDNKNLAYNIIENSKKSKNGTILTNNPLTKVAEEISLSGNTGRFINTTVEVANYNWVYAETEDALWRCLDEEDCPVITKCTDDLREMWLYDVDGYFDEAETTDLIQVTGCDGDKPKYNKEILYEQVLSVTPDDFGISYYYRGNVTDNYVTFADMCWRIVRIEGDGSIKLILEDQDQACSSNIDGNWNIPSSKNFSYQKYEKNTLTSSDGIKNSNILYIMDYLNGVQNESEDSMSTYFKNFQNTFTDIELSKLKVGRWCLADKGYTRSGTSDLDYIYTLLNETQKLDNKIKGINFYYDSYVRLSGENQDGYLPTLICNGTKMDKFGDNETEMYVGTLTADEIVFAGGKIYTDVFHPNVHYYLYNKMSNGIDRYWWSLSPFNSYDNNDGITTDSIISFYEEGDLFADPVTDYNNYRPSIILKSESMIVGGEGTIDNPYVIA